MQPQDLSTPRTQTPKKGSNARIAMSLLLLVAVIGGLAWVAQFLRSGPNKDTPTPAADDKPLLDFTRKVAQWGPFPYKEFESGTQGRYDFLFKNVLGRDIELVAYQSTCDCTSVKACALPADEVRRVDEQQKAKPGETPTYAQEPEWRDLPNDPLKPASILIKAGEGGVVSVRWHARKSPGQNLNLQPKISAQPAGDPGGRRNYPLVVPAMMSLPVRIYPPRSNYVNLIAGSVVTVEFDAWSSTRETFDLQLNQHAPDPLVVVNVKPLKTQQERDKLNEYLLKNKIATRVLSASHITVTIHENKDGHQFDQGAFYRKLAITLGGTPLPDLPGPEIVGRVMGDIQIGGADDLGKIRFKSFEAAIGATKSVELQTDDKTELETFKHDPSWLKVHLTRAPKVVQHKRVWHLKITVEPKTPGARSFEEPDAVTLKIAGAAPRFLRIPIEGHVSR